MTLFYQTNSWSSQPQPGKTQTKLWKHIANKENWHDVTRRETLEGAEIAIDQTVAHYAKKVEFINGPVVVKTFK